MKPDIFIKQADWNRDKQTLRQLRETVFIEEQHVPPELEWDEHDAACTHVIAYAGDDQPIGTARILNNGHIGRMAVMQQWRNQGVGSRMLTRLIEIARQRGLNKVYLHAQTGAIGFYRKHGFVIISDEFMDAGIPHREMELIL